MSVARPPGFNPIRHDCNQYGCYIAEHHPKSEWFAHVFPGKVSFSDMDRIVELGGRALVLEWKGCGGIISKGQEIMWSRLTRGCMVTTIAVKGNPKTMEIEEYRVCYNGKWRDWKEAGLIDLNERITAWKDWALANPVFSVSINGTKAAT